MLKRSTFKRLEYVRPPPSAPTRCRPSRMDPIGDVVVAVAKSPVPVRDESYRRRVAALPCFNCRIEGRSQAAHPNSGKTKGVKHSDLLCFPLCADGPGYRGCHSSLDTYKLVPRAEMPDYERRAHAWTVEQLGR